MAPRDPRVWESPHVALKSLSHLKADSHPSSALKSSPLKVRVKMTAPPHGNSMLSLFPQKKKAWVDQPDTSIIVYSIALKDRGSKCQKTDLQTNLSKMELSHLYTCRHFVPTSPHHFSAESAAQALGQVVL